ncbi:MAG: hypothetical protein HZB53_17260 [Chloroflexi bacterium]|nr:hypothetical protein [Chloroflexota bacterium]
MSNRSNKAVEEFEPATTIDTALWLMLGAAAGALVAAVVLPAWMPSLVSSLLGPEPKAYWYLSRASALVAYGLVWVSVALGLMVTNRMARIWPGGPAAADVHEFASLLGLSVGLFHALILMGDKYANFSLAQILIPFGGNEYRPVWVGIGQIAIYLGAVVAFSVYVRRYIGYRTWRLLHYSSLLAFVGVLVHAVMSGTDTAGVPVQLYYWATGGAVLFLFIYRVTAGKSARPQASGVARAPRS